MRIGMVGQLAQADQIVGQIETAEQLEVFDQTEKVAEQSGLGWSESIGTQ